MTADIAVIGAGAAGLMAAISAGRHATAGTRLVTVDGAKKLGAKILVAGGGRCNVTHFEVDERQYAGSSPREIQRVLRQFDVPRTVAFFADLGVELKREETGKLFPVTDEARTVLDALLRAASGAKVEVWHPWRVSGVRREDGEFVVERKLAREESGDGNELRVKRLVLATGGRALPLTGSDGVGYEFAKALGHTVTSRVFPALVPLTLPKGHELCGLSGLTLPATLDLRASTGKKLKSFTNSTLLTHFGLSGPSVLDISRYYTQARVDDPGARLTINFLPSMTPEQLDQRLVDTRTSRLSVGRWLPDQALPPGADAPALPERLARVLCAAAGVDGLAPVSQLSREQRKSLVEAVTMQTLPITGDRGYTYAEVTAGGVPLSEIDLSTMESRICPGLHLCGEVCDVDGRIGGFNFQWAWASGFVAGKGAAGALASA